MTVTPGFACSKSSTTDWMTSASRSVKKCQNEMVPDNAGAVDDAGALDGWAGADPLEPDAVESGTAEAEPLEPAALDDGATADDDTGGAAVLLAVDEPMPPQPARVRTPATARTI